MKRTPLVIVAAFLVIASLVYGAALTTPDGVNRATGGQANNPLMISQTLIGDGVGQRTEKITEGTFDTSANWTAGTGWTITTSADVSGVAGVGTLSQSLTSMSSVPVLGELMLVTYTIGDYISGTMQVSVGGSYGTIRSAAGTYAEYITAVATMPFVLTPSSDASMNIDNISVVKVDGNPQNLGRMARSQNCDVQISGTIPTNVVVQVKGSKDGTSYKNMIDGTGYTTTFTEKLTEGNFSTSANWVLGTGWTVTTFADVSGSAGVGTLSEPSANMVTAPVPGEKYLVGYTISNYSTGSVTVSIGNKKGTPRSANGTFQENITAVDTTGLVFTPSTNANLRIDNVSVIKNENNGVWIVNRPVQWIKGSFVSKTGGDASTAVTLDCVSVGD